MVKRLFASFGKKSDPELITSFVNLEMGRAEDGLTPRLRCNKEISPAIPVIGVGGAGSKITDLIVKRLAWYGVGYQSLAVDINKNELDTLTSISQRYTLKSATHSTSKQFLKGQAIAKDQHEELKGEISSYLESFGSTHNKDIVFLVVGGGGGTGVGVSLEIAAILKEMGRIPVPILLLPSMDESTRCKFNAAVALYNFSYAPSDRCLNLSTLCIDNQLFINNNSFKNTVVMNQQMNERIAAAIGDLIISTELPSSGYSLDLNEFIEIFRKVKGLAVLSFLQTREEGEIISIFKSNEDKINSLHADLTTGTRSYIFVQTADKQLSSKSYRSLISNFNMLDAFPKLSEDGEEEFIAIRAITTGIKIPQRIVSMMTYAEDVRVTLLQKEVNNAKSGKGNPKIDKLDGDNTIEVMDHDELSEVRSKELAEKRRRGDIS